MDEEHKARVESTVREEIHRNSRKEERVRIVLESLRGEVTIAELCRREGLHPNMYDKCSKDFLEAGKARLVEDVSREADSQENKQLKALLAEARL